MPLMRAGTQRRVALFVRTLGAGALIGAVFGLERADQGEEDSG
jgi:hypothetical protein